MEYWPIWQLLDESAANDAGPKKRGVSLAKASCEGLIFK
jgi:hypothetical protein